MAGISDEKLEELRERVDVAAVVGRRVQLKRSGRDLRGLCPFHGEKTPSFYVVPDKKIYHCFGCGKTGDAIKFVMELEGKSFREAIEQLANEFGVVLETEDPAERKRAARRAALAEVNEKACTFFERVLWEHPRGQIAREHLEKRGVSVETAKAWRLGYAPPLWDALYKSLKKNKVDDSLIEEAGLGIPRKGGRGPAGLYDRFRGRLTIPIRESGRTVAFGGRLLEGESEAKYLNSPETPLYQKGHTLFALDKSREGIRREGIVLFTEGYFDAIGLHQAGVPVAVATCGTAMTERHLELVTRAGAKELIFVFDGDNAGIRAATRASELAAAAGVAARVLVPPNGEDPDETVARIGTPAFRELVRNAEPSLQFLLEKALAQVGTSIEARVRAVDSIAGIVRAAPNALARELYLEKVAEKLQAPVDVVKLAIDQAPAAPAAHEPRAGSVRNQNINQNVKQFDRRPEQAQRGPQRDRGSQGERSSQGGSQNRYQNSRTPNGVQGLRSGQSRNNAASQPSTPGAPQAPQSPKSKVESPRAPPTQPRAAAPLQELHIVAQALVSAERSLRIEALGGTAHFTNASLRDVAERAFSQARDGSFDRDALISGVERDELRIRLEKDAASQEAVNLRLRKMMEKHAKTAQVEAIHRRRSPQG